MAAKVPWYQWRTAKDTISWGMLARLLPYIEQDNLLRQADITRNTLGQAAANGSALTKVKVFNCPSDPDSASTGIVQPHIFLRETDPTAPLLGTCNYLAVIGCNWCWSSWRNNHPDAFNPATCDPGWGAAVEHTNGIFSINYDLNQGRFDPVNQQKIISRKLADVTDGTSNTFLIGEIVLSKGINGLWAHTDFNQASCAMPPNLWKRQNVNPRNWADSLGFQSMHPGGVQFAFADGSVRLISDAIALPVYRSLSTRAGGEIVSNY
jgi:prepilin-type processing-associated H-X9-DG protein